MKLILIIFGILVVFVIIAARALKSRKKMDMIQATSNTKSIYLLLMDFEGDYGHFPDDASAAKSIELNEFRGSFSNDYLGQLIAGGFTKSEQIFFAKNRRYQNKQADDVISPQSEILRKGECGYSYVMAEDKGEVRALSTRDNGGIPILAAPLVDAIGTCEANTYNGRGVYLRVDGSARNEPLLTPSEKIKAKGSITLFDTGTDTVWGTELKPVILLPER